MTMVHRLITVLRLRLSRTGRSTFAGIAGLATDAFGALHLVRNRRFRS
jgi:hypothetical protein